MFLSTIFTENQKGNFPMELTDRANVRQLLQRYGLEPKKGRGQNFLASPQVVSGITSLCGDSGLCVIEIGPGIGAMTVELSKKYKKVVAVEIDSGLIPLLSETLSGCENVEVICADAMKTDFHALIKEKFPGERVCVCANLPYYITSPVIMKLLDCSELLESVTVMIQKEVADRLCAQAGSDDFGAISLFVQYKSEAEKCFTVPAGCFLPPPKITSSAVKLTMRKTPPVNVIDPENMFALIRAAFSQRRKTFVNAVSSSCGGKYSKEEISAFVSGLGLDANARGETLGLAEYAALSDLIKL